MNALRRLEWVRWWWPALLWAVLISGFSTDTFSGEHTSGVFIPILHWLFPTASGATLEHLHLFIRKCAHLGEYFLFGLLVFRGIRGGRRGWKMEWAVRAVAVAAGWAALDELHQAFVPSRGPSMTDVLIDTCGAIAGQIVLAGVLLLRSRFARGAGDVDSTDRIV